MADTPDSTQALYLFTKLKLRFSIIGSWGEMKLNYKHKVACSLSIVVSSRFQSYNSTSDQICHFGVLSGTSP